MLVHAARGSGSLESACEAHLDRELRKRGLRFEAQVPIAVRYDGGHRLHSQISCDLSGLCVDLLNFLQACDQFLCQIFF